MARILVIDDEDSVRLAVKRRLEREGYEVTLAGTFQEAVRTIQTDELYDVIVTDMSIDSPSTGLDIIHVAFKRDIFAEVIVMTAYGNVANAVESMRRGAFDYIEKNAPGDDPYEKIVEKVQGAMERRVRDLRTMSQWQQRTEGAPPQ